MLLCLYYNPDHVNGHVWGHAVRLLSLSECSNGPVTLTHFLKMQLPVEPSCLPAATFAGRTGSGRKEKGSAKEREGKERSKTGLDGIICTFYGSVPKKFELIHKKREETKGHALTLQLSKETSALYPNENLCYELRPGPCYLLRYIHCHQMELREMINKFHQTAAVLNRISLLTAL